MQLILYLILQLFQFDNIANSCVRRTCMQLSNVISLKYQNKIEKSHNKSFLIQTENIVVPLVSI